jgi:hypothetical protein
MMTGFVVHVHGEEPGSVSPARRCRPTRRGSDGFDLLPSSPVGAGSPSRCGGAGGVASTSAGRACAARAAPPRRVITVRVHRSPSRDWSLRAPASSPGDADVVTTTRLTARRPPREPSASPIVSPSEGRARLSPKTPVRAVPFHRERHEQRHHASPVAVPRSRRARSCRARAAARVDRLDGRRAAPRSARLEIRVTQEDRAAVSAQTAERRRAGSRRARRGPRPTVAPPDARPTARRPARLARGPRRPRGS